MANRAVIWLRADAKNPRRCVDAGSGGAFDVDRKGGEHERLVGSESSCVCVCVTKGGVCVCVLVDPDGGRYKRERGRWQLRLNQHIPFCAPPQLVSEENN